MGHRTDLAAAGDERKGNTMTPEEWRKVKGVLEAALELDPPERE